MTGHAGTTRDAGTTRGTGTGRAGVQIFCASTLYGAATLAAALDAGLFEAADRRLLLVFTNTPTPETSRPLDAMPGFARLRDRFDAVLSWNEVIRPHHPAAWSPRAEDVPLLERWLRLLWDLGDARVELVLESLQVAPALSVAELFPGAPLHVYADGLMSYGPTRTRLDPLVGTRVRRLLHLDLVPGLRPLLLGEFGVPAQVIPAEPFVKVLGELAEDAGELPQLPDNAALLLGQYLSALGILTPEQEEELHVRMLRGAVARGHRTVVFKPHPSAPPRIGGALEEAARESGAELIVLDVPVLAETLFARMRPALVVSCFSTALFTASALYGLPVARAGTRTLLERLTPYQNSNRVPAVLTDAVTPDLEDDGPGEAPLPADQVPALVEAVGYAMQPRLRPDLRASAERFLTERHEERVKRYFTRGRLASLGLPGGLPRRLAFVSRSAAARRVARRARALGRGLRR